MNESADILVLRQPEKDIAGPRQAAGKESRPNSQGLLASAARRRWRAAVKLAGATTPPSLTVDYFAELDDEPSLSYGQLLSQDSLGSIERKVGAYVAAYQRHAAKVLLALQGAAECDGLIKSTAVCAGILFAFAERLKAVAGKAVAALINVARMSGEISGETSDDRWRAFEHRLLDREYRLRCRDRFPVLDEILATITADAEACWREFFRHLRADIGEIESFFPGGLGRIQRLQFYAGDPHNGGRSVVLIYGESGKVVYKPRPLRTDEALARAIDWLDGHIGLGLRHLAVLGRPSYGWISFAEPVPCDSQKDVERCFVRSGALMALLHVLGAGDLHNENILCIGDLPVIIDAEVLFNGSIDMRTREMRARQRARIETVQNLCYLPSFMVMGDSVVDITGAGFAPGQEVALRAAIADDPEGDLLAQPKTIKLPDSHNLPLLNGGLQSAYENRQAIVEGFRLALTAIMRHRDELLHRSDLMPAFADIPSRFIARGTAVYGQIARHAHHPYAVANRDRHDAALSALAGESGWRESVIREILAADILAIRRGDVPFFKSVADSCSIWTSDGREIKNVFQESGYAAAVKRISRLTNRAIQRQVDFIELAFGINAGRSVSAGRPEPDFSSISSRAERVRIATGIGDRLLDQAIVTRGHIFWMGRAQIRTHFSSAMIETELYGGVSGIGVFFAELARITSLNRFRRAALLCRRTWQHASRGYYNRIGAFDGLAGLVYAELVVSKALNLPLDKGTGIHLEQLANRVGRDRSYDIISGASGTLLVALRAQAWPELKEAASRLADVCVDHLMSHATKSGDALTWKSPAFENVLAGMAHGSCGIGMALAEYAAITGSPECWSAAVAALRFASQSFDEEAGTWRDLRHESGHMVAWCHGAAGIVLARQRVLELAPLHAEPWIRDEVESGLKTLREQSGPSSDTLCHGRSGNWEPLWRGRAIEREIAERQVSSLCAHLSDNNLPGGDFVTPTPDLMNGWAGIGLQILRSIDPGVADVTTLRA